MEGKIEFLTVPEVAVELRLSKAAVYALIKAKKLGHYKFGGAIRIGKEQFDKFKRDSRQENPSERRRPRAAPYKFECLDR